MLKFSSHLKEIICLALSASFYLQVKSKARLNASTMYRYFGSNFLSDLAKGGGGTEAALACPGWKAT